jgi:hypothetical protein
MESSGLSNTTPIDIPLERSLYVGNILRSILYGEISRKSIVSLVQVAHTTGGRIGDLHILRRRILHLPSSPRIPKTPEILYSVWWGPALAHNDRGILGRSMGPIHVDRPPRPSGGPARVFPSITRRVVRCYGIWCQRHDEYSRRRAPRASRLPSNDTRRLTR